MFLRVGSALPERLVLREKQFCEDWMMVDDLTAAALDEKIRRAGWHFLWTVGSIRRRAFAWSSDSAIDRALRGALRKMTRFNAAELGAFLVKRFPGFSMGMVILHPRQIQQLTSLDTPAAQTRPTAA